MPIDQDRTEEYLLKARKATGFSWRETCKRAKAVIFNLEEEMKKRGAQYEKAMLPIPPMLSRMDG